jgi:ribokinase
MAVPRLHESLVGASGPVARVAVVGHVDWVEFVRVDYVPSPGDIVRARERWEEPGGGGAVAAAQLAGLAGDCLLLTALAEDDAGRRCAGRLAELDVTVRGARRPAPQRRAFVHVDQDGERTITLLGERMAPRGADALPWDALARVDAVYFAGGDADALRAARAARVLVATARAADAVRGAGVELDALVASGAEPGERLHPEERVPTPRLSVTTLGSRGGSWVASDGRAETWEPARVRGRCVNSYGAGDSFAAGLTYGLATIGEVKPAVALAASCGAAAVTGRGACDGQLTLSPGRAPTRPPR